MHYVYAFHSSLRPNITCVGKMASTTRITQGCFLLPSRDLTKWGIIPNTLLQVARTLLLRMENLCRTAYLGFRAAGRRLIPRDLMRRRGSESRGVNSRLLTTLLPYCKIFTGVLNSIHLPTKLRYLCHLCALFIIRVNLDRLMFLLQTHQHCPRAEPSYLWFQERWIPRNRRSSR